MKIQKVYTTDIPKLDIYNAWVSQNMIIEPITQIESDPRTGGKFILYFKYPNGQPAVMRGKFLKVIKNNIIKYSWKWDHSDEDTIVTVKFRQSEGKTFVALEHEGFKSEQSKSAHAQGWDNYFEKLEKTIKQMKEKN